MQICHIEIFINNFFLYGLLKHGAAHKHILQ